MAKNPVSWWEIASRDGDKTARFLKGLFNWDLKYDEKSGIYVLPVGEGENSGFNGGGIFTLKSGKIPHVTIYVKVEDVDAMASRVEELGGMIYEPPHDIPEVSSRICLFTEPTGLILAVSGPMKD